MQRLKTRAQFQAVLAGATVARTAHFAMHRCALAPAAGAEPLFDRQSAWIGAMVPKRWARRAVTRNAIKRQIYQVTADAALSLPDAAHVVRLRAAFDRQKFPSASSDALKAAVRAELQQLLARTVAAGA
jgi:ribonuclease P protein component